jgi:hypothetical protein
MPTVFIVDNSTTASNTYPYTSGYNNIPITSNVLFNQQYISSNVLNQQNFINSNFIQNSLSADFIKPGISNKFIVNDSYSNDITFKRNVFSSNIITSNLFVIDNYTVLNTSVYQTEQLQITNNATATALKVSQTTANQNVAEFYNNTNLALVVNNSGNIGIGTTNPLNNLYVNGNALIANELYIGNQTGEGILILNDINTAKWKLRTANYCLNFESDNSGSYVSKFAISAVSGNVGIGIITPSYKLHIQDTTNAPLVNMARNLSSGSSAYSAFGIQNNGPNGCWLFLNSSTRTTDGGVNTATLRNDAGDLRLQSSASGNAALNIHNGVINIHNGTYWAAIDRMKQGSLSIGSTDSSFGGSFFSGGTWPVGANTAGLLLECTANTEIAVYHYGSKAISTMYYSNNTITVGRDMGWGNPTNINLLATSLYLSGNVGIGITNPTEKLQVNGNIYGKGTFLFKEDRGTVDSRNWCIRQNNSYEGAFQIGCIDNNSGSIPDMFTTPSLAKFTILNNGNIGIGTHNPSKKLTVLGQADFSGSTSGYANPLIKITQNAAWNGNYALQISGYTDLGGIRINGGDLERSIFKIASGNMGLSTFNGDILFNTNNVSEKMRILNSGNIGIGITNPANLLHIHANLANTYTALQLTDNTTGITSNSGFIISKEANQDVKIMNCFSNANMIFGTSNTEDMRITSNGNIGIGITNPNINYKLDVNGIINATDIYKNGSVFSSSQWTTSGTNIYYNAGNVSIGTSASIGGLQINREYTSVSPALNNHIYCYNPSSAANSYCCIAMRSKNTTGNRSFMAYDVENSHGWAVGVKGDDTVNKGLYFNNGWQFTGTDVLSILNNGNIGIGTNPNYKLDVNGIINATDIYKNGSAFSSSQWTTSNANIYYNVGNIGIGTNNPKNLLHLHSNANNSYCAIQLTDNTTGVTSNSGFIISKESNQDVKFTNYYSTGNIIFANSNTEQLRITSNGYIGIGNSNPSYNLDVVGTIKTNSLFVNYTNIAYPPKQCTSFSNVSSTTLLGKTYYLQSIVLDNTNILSGYGTYNIYTNSYYSGYSVKNLFNYSYLTYGTTTNSFAWASGVWTNGIYNNTTTTNTIDNLYYGDVIIVQLPVSIALSSYDIWALNGTAEEKGRAPGEWKVYGSTNGVNFFELSNASQTSTRLTIDSYTGSEFKYTKTIIGNSLSYNWYGICINKLAGTSSLLHIRELRFYANDNLSTIVKNGNVGIGNTNPKVKLQITNGAVGISGNANQGAIISGFNTAPGSLTIGDIQTRYGNKVMVNKSIPTIDFIPTITINGSTNLLTNILNTQDYYYSFINTGANTLNIPVNVTCDILIIGGGGSGGTRHAGGGGAGALIYLQNQVLTSGTYTVNIGIGGTAVSGTAVNGNNGNDTYITLNGIDVYRANGGGGGGAAALGVGIAGGSSGGSAGGTTTISNPPLINNIPTGTYGNYGGKGSYTTGGAEANYAGGGGGGAGTAGYDASQTLSPAGVGGNGGNGSSININGNSVYYAGGGGGGCAASSTSAGTGGIGGGGAGSKSNTTAVSGTVNTGGGGGGAGFSGAANGTSGAGGSGIVIIRFKFDNFLINNTAGLLMECVDNTEIAVYNNGTSLNSLVYYDNSNITIGRDMGWGSPSNLNLIGSNVNLFGNININNKTSATSLKVIQSSVSQNLAEFYNISNLALVINNTGTVGINTTIPNSNYKLDVNGIINATDIYKNGVPFISSTSSQWTTSNANIYYNIGNIGIGTNNPTNLLHIHSNANNSYCAIQLTDNTTGVTSNSGFIISKESNQDVKIMNCFAANMIFGTSNTEDMRITNNGNIGIGISNPTQKLEVAGNIKAQQLYIYNINSNASIFFSPTPPPIFSVFFKKTPWAMYFAEDYNIASNTLFNYINNGRNATTTGTITKTTASGNGAIGNITYISGGTTSTLIFPDNSIPVNFTILSLTRYNGNNKNRILQASGINWLHGHATSTTKTCYYPTAYRSDNITTNMNDWLCCIGKNGGIAPNNILMDGVATGKAPGGTGGSSLRINTGWDNANKSDWALSCVMIWDSLLTDEEMINLNTIVDNYKNNGISIKSLLLTMNDDECCIESRVYGENEKSELLLFKGNDPMGSNGVDRIRLKSGNIAFDTYSSSTTDRNTENIKMLINQDGYVGINNNTPGYQLDVNGIINATDINKNGISISSLISNSAVLNTVITDVSYCNSFLANTFYNNSNSTNIYFNNNTLNNIGISKNNYYAVSFSNGNASVQNVSSFPILYNSNLNIINPIVWYKFNSNNFLNDYGSSNYGSLTSYNNTTYSTLNKYRGTASASFTVTATNYLTMPITVNLNSIQTTSGITFSVWAKINTNSGTWARIFDFDYNLTGAPIILMSKNNTTNTINFSNQTNYYTTNSYIDNNWHHYVLTISKTGQWYIYIDGVLASFTTALPTNSNLPNYPVAIAYFGKSYYSSDGYLDGNISDFRIYNLDLTASQAAILYNNTNIYTDYSYSIVKDLNNNLLYPTLWYKFDNNLLDSSGNNNHLILYAGNYNYSSTVVAKGNYSIKPNSTVTLTSTNNITINNTNTNITIAFWFNVYGLNLIYDTLIYSPVFGLENLCITRAVATNKLNFRFAGSAWFRTTTDYYLNDNKWYHLTMVGEKIGAATRISLYINGVFKENNGAGGTGTWASFSEQLGVFTNNEINCAYAYLDDLRVYVGTVLTSNQIQELYNGSVNFYHTPKLLTYTDTTSSYSGALCVSGNSISNGALMSGYNTISGALTIGDINTRYGGKTAINKTLTNINNIPTITINSSTNLLTNIQNTQDYYYSFTSTGSNNLILSSNVNCDILIVGGGGSGGCRTGGGGGAGALIYLQNQTLTTGTYSVYVGAGGTAVSGAGQNGNNGGDSYIQNSLLNDIYRAKGGGAGGNPYAGVAGGSSGGTCGGSILISADPLTTNVPVGIYGNYGGKGSGGGGGEITFDAGGGGGAGSSGSNGIVTGQCGNGGNGLLININGLNTYYAGGGGGGGGSGTTAGTGGLGGGGSGTAGPSTAISGTANTGGGGGGSGYTSSTNGISGAGGSGIIIIRFKFDKNLANNTAGLLLECSDNTEIAVYNKGSNINSLIYYENSNIAIGRDMGWGSPLNVNLIGNNINFNGYTKTSNIEFDYLFSRQDRSYPPKAWNFATAETTTTFLGKLCYKQTLTLTSDGITYGSGNYIVYSSTTFGSYFKELLFNYITLTDTGGVWTASSYTNGVYTGANNDTIDGTYFGEWLVIKLPKPIILKSYTFWTRNSYNSLSPGEWKFYGSVDGVSFVEIVDASQTSKIVAASYNGTSYTKNILNYNTPFLYYGFCVNKLTGTDVTNLSFTEFRLYGDEPTINNTDTPLKITNNLSIGEISNNSEIRQYPPKAYTSSTSLTTGVTFLTQTCIQQSFTLDTVGITYGSGSYNTYISTSYANSYPISTIFNFTINNTDQYSSAATYDASGNYNGSPSYYINSDYRGNFIIINLPTSINLRYYTIYVKTNMEYNRNPAEWKFYGSLDGTIFTEIPTASQLTRLTASDYSTRSYTYTKQVLNNTKYYNWYGICINKIVGGTDGILNICELQLFGTEYPSETYALTVNPNNIITNVNVGIGTVAPTNLLHLHKNTSNTYNAIQLTDNTTGITSNSGFIISKEANQDVKIMNCYAANMIFGTSNTEDMRITQKGFVSIDNNNPYINFNVGSNNNNHKIGRAIINANGLHHADKQDSLQIGRWDDAISIVLTNGLDGSFTGLKYNVVPGAPNNYTNITFHTWGNNISVSREVMRLNHYGYLGIGTTNPQNHLDVAGTINATTDIKINNVSLSSTYITSNVLGQQKFINSNFIQNSLSADFIKPGTSNKFIVNDSYNNDITFKRNVFSSNIITSNLFVIDNYTVLNTSVYQTEQLQITNTATATALKVSQTTANQNVAEFYNNTNNPALVINKNGNIGIGTTDPLFKLHIPTVDSATPTNVLSFKNTADYGIYATSASISARGNSLDFLSKDYNTGTITTRNVLSLKVTGNIGIGTDAPTSLLHLYSTTQAQARLILAGTEFYQGGANTSTEGIAFLCGVNRTGNRQLWIADSAALGIGTTNTVLKIITQPNKVYIDSHATDGGTRIPMDICNGAITINTIYNVGVGTGAPTNLLHLHKNAASTYNAIQLTDNTTGVTATSGFIISKETNQDVKIMNCYAANMIFGTSNTEYMKILTNGNIGIGSTTPLAKLCVQGSISLSGPNACLFWGGTSALMFETTAGFTSSSSAISDLVLRSDITKKLILQSGAGAGAIIIDGTNNVGIGKTNPNYKLDVNGNINCSDLILDGSLTSGTISKTSGAIDIKTASSTPITFTQGTSEIMRIHTNNNVGIGTNTPTNILHLHKNTANTYNAIQLTDTTTGVTATSGFIISKETNQDVKIMNCFTSGGNMIFGTSNTEDMRILSNGNIGIGKTNPNYLLDVAGIINASNIYINGSNFTGSSQWITSTSNIYYNKGNVGIGGTYLPETSLDIYSETYTKALLVLDVGSSSSTSGMPRGIGNPLIKLGKYGYTTSSGDYYGIGFGYAPFTGNKQCCEIGCITTYNPSGPTIIGDLVFSTQSVYSSTTPATERMRITSTGAVGIGVTNPSGGSNLTVGGEIRCFNDIAAFYSDIRLKKITSNITNAVSIIENISAFKYTASDLAINIGLVKEKDKNKEFIGVSAQDVNKVIPEIVSIAPFDLTEDTNGNIISKSGENYLTLKYDKLTPILIEAVKELKKEILFNKINTCYNYIPNIYKFCTCISNIIRININISNILKINDKIKIISNEINVDYIVINIIDNNTFIIDKIINDNNVFVYGTYIENIQSLDNSYLLNLINNTSDELYKIINNFQNNISETKKLYKIIEKLQERIEVLENK